MLKIRRISISCLLTILLSAAFVSCSREESTTPSGDSKVCLALRVGLPSETKANVSLITELQKDGASFRGLDEVKVIPFAKSGEATEVSTGDEPLTLPLSLPGFETTSHLYQMHQSIPVGTGLMLAYGKGKAPMVENSEVKTNQVYGSLDLVGFDGSATTAAGLGFSPTPMFGSTTETPSEAKVIANTLSSIVNGVSCTITAYLVNPNSATEDILTDANNAPVSREVTVVWDENIGDPHLNDCYDQLTAEGRLLSGSGENVGGMLTTLYRALELKSLDNAPFTLDVDGVTYQTKKKVEDEYSALLRKDLYNELRTVIKGRFTALATGENPVLDIDNVNKEVVFHEAEVREYPEHRGLPSGAASVRWSPTGYVVPLQNGLDGIAALSDYCFPPALYYYANTTIQTSDDEDLSDVYESGSSWENILNSYDFGTKVNALTESVALVKPLSFGVGMLAATVKAEKKELLDNNYHTQITLSEDTFTLTGIVIGRQYPQHFDFTPVYDAVNEPRQYYLYDNKISGVSLTNVQSKEFRTLALQTPKEKSVYVSLEFVNNSGKTFYGIEEGRILPGHHFYLVGLLEVPAGKTAEDGTPLDSVFIQDRITTVNFTIKSLKNAYSTIPDMGIPQLSIGVLAQVNWMMATPTEVWLD